MSISANFGGPVAVRVRRPRREREAAESRASSAAVLGAGLYAAGAAALSSAVPALSPANGGLTLAAHLLAGVTSAALFARASATARRPR